MAATSRSPSPLQGLPRFVRSPWTMGSARLDVRSARARGLLARRRSRDLAGGVPPATGLASVPSSARSADAGTASTPAARSPTLARPNRGLPRGPQPRSGQWCPAHADLAQGRPVRPMLATGRRWRNWLPQVSDLFWPAARRDQAARSRGSQPTSSSRAVLLPGERPLTRDTKVIARLRRALSGYPLELVVPDLVAGRLLDLLLSWAGPVSR